MRGGASAKLKFNILQFNIRLADSTSKCSFALLECILNKKPDNVVEAKIVTKEIISKTKEEGTYEEEEYIESV